MIDLLHVLDLTSTPDVGTVLADNPLTGVEPNMSILGEQFKNTWVKIAGALWLLCVMGTIIYLAKAFLEYATARSRGYSEKVTEAAKEVKHALVGLSGLAALPVIVSTVFFVFNFK